jgi:MFS family permease
MSTGGIARAAVPVISTFVISELDITTAQFGLSVTVMIAAVAVGVPVFGQLTDRRGARTVLVWRGGTAALALVGIALSNGFGQLLVFQALLGLAISGGVPASNRVVAEAVPLRSRGLAIGAKQAGATAGVLVAGIVIPFIAVRLGWRWSIATAALLSVLTVPALYYLVPRSLIEAAPRGSSRSSWAYLLANTSTRWLSAHGFISGAGIAMVFSFLPLYAAQEIGLGPQAAGAVLSVMSVMAVIARLSWGRISDVTGDLGRNLRWISGLAVVAVGLIGSAARIGPLTLWAGAMLAGLSMEAWNAVAGNAVISAVPTSQSGRASSMVQLAFMAGNATGPVMFGVFVDATESFTLGWSVCAGLFVLATVLRYRPEDAGVRVS